MAINFNEAWSHLSGHEKGHDFLEDDDKNTTTKNIEGYDLESEEADKNISSLFDIKEISNTDEIAKELYNGFMKSLLGYIQAIDKLTSARKDKESDAITKNQADHARRIAHDSWLSSANALSRYCDKLGLDNTWRSVIGFDRKKQTNWVLSVSSMARKMALM